MCNLHIWLEKKRDFHSFFFSLLDLNRVYSMHWLSTNSSLSKWKRQSVRDWTKQKLVLFVKWIENQAAICSLVQGDFIFISFLFRVVWIVNLHLESLTLCLHFFRHVGLASGLWILYLVFLFYSALQDKKQLDFLFAFIQFLVGSFWWFLCCRFW